MSTKIPRRELEQLVLGDIPVPDGCRAYEWNSDDTGRCTRLLTRSSRSLHGMEAAAYVDGVQDITGTVRYELAIRAADTPITSDQAREFAAMVAEAADEFDRLTEATP
jgi:hypothetical protein